MAGGGALLRPHCRMEEKRCFLTKIGAPGLNGWWWAWATPAKNTRTPATMSAFSPWTSWPSGPGCPVQKLKHRALTNTLEVGGVKVLLMKPVTYMNLSGEAVGEAARFYKLPPERVLVISDDVSLPVGKLRIRKGGSAGGHNGLKSIIQHLGTDQFPRIKVGVGQKPHPDYDMADWVLSKFAGEDLKTITEAIRKAADAVECLIQEGPDKAMNRFNG